jgi:heat shock protein HslJ
MGALLRCEAVAWCGFGLLVCVAACSAGGAQDHISPSADKPPTASELASATYEGVVQTPVTLEGGRWEGEPFVEGGAARPSVGLVEHFSLTGDLDLDGRPEAVALLWESSGGSGTRSYLAVMKRQGGEVRNLGTALIGDRVQLVSAAVMDGRIILQLVEAGADDAACCPTQRTASAWGVTNAGLERVSNEILGTLSLADLAGSEWRLVELGRGHDPPPGTSITIEFHDDRVSGTTGCNSYFGTVSSTRPGELSMTATGSTQKACPETAMELEQRYLQALAGASHYGFLGGRLVLTSNTGELPVALVFARDERTD